jgi:hypothetical protein
MSAVQSIAGNLIDGNINIDQEYHPQKPVSFAGTSLLLHTILEKPVVINANAPTIEDNHHE